MTKRSRQATKGESVQFTRTKDRMCSCLMVTMAGSLHTHEHTMRTLSPEVGFMGQAYLQKPAASISVVIMTCSACKHHSKAQRFSLN